MVTYLSTRHDTLDGVLALPPDDPPPLELVTYDALWSRSSVSDGPVVFADLERLQPGARDASGEVWAALAGASEGRGLLNHPTTALRRLELLQRLHGEGVNRFTAHRVAELPEQLRFPVFLRDEADHGGNRSPLVSSWAELHHWVALARCKAALNGLDRSFLVVEALDGSDEHGIHRKYSAFRVGERIFPRHLLFSRHWVVKTPDLVEGDLLREERAYVDAHPHEAWLRHVFDLARIDYGRIDYGIVDGELQAWEINTNPVVIKVGSHVGVRGDLNREIAATWWAAVRALEDVGRPASSRPFPVVRPAVAPVRQAPRRGPLGRVRQVLRRHRGIGRVAARALQLVPTSVLAKAADVAERRRKGRAHPDL